MQSQVSGSPQPQSLDSCSPSTASPIPPETRIAPRQSSDAGWRSSAGLESAISTSAMIATGMLTQKIARQSIAVR